MGVYVDKDSGNVVIGGTSVESIYGAGSIIKHTADVGMFQVEVTDAALVDDNDQDNNINTDLKLNAKLAVAEGADDTKRVRSATSVDYWSGRCADADLDNPDGTITLGDNYEADVLLSSKRDVKGSTTDVDDKKLFGCLRLNNPDNGAVKHYGDLHVEVDIGIASKVLGTAHNDEAIDTNDFDYKGNGATSIFLSEEWSLSVDANTIFAGVNMQNDGLNNGITAQSLGADSDGTDKQMEVIVPITSAHGLTVPDVSISHAYFVSGYLRGATATMSIDDSKYTEFKGTKLETAEVTCETGVTAPDLTVTCTVSGGAHFTLPYDHVKQSYVSDEGCNGGLCGGKIEIEPSGPGTGGFTGAWFGAGISAWATSNFACAHPAFSAVAPIATTFFDSVQKDLSDILSAGNEDRDCELDDTLSFVKPSDDHNLVSGCVGGTQVVGDAASRDEGLNFIKNKYGDCKVAEPGEFADAVQDGEVVGIQASCSDGVSADQTACEDAQNTWRAPVSSGDLFRNTKRLGYVYGVSSTSSGATMSTTYSTSTTTFLIAQTSRSCTASASAANNLIATKQTDFQTAKTTFESAGTLNFNIGQTDVEFDVTDTNTKTQGGETLRARCGVETAQVTLTCELDDRTDISDPGSVTASASVSAPETVPAISYDLLKDDVSEAKSGIATTDTAYAQNGDGRSDAVYKKSITYDGFDDAKTYKITFASDGGDGGVFADYAFNCGNGGDVETYIGSTDLPCTGTQDLEHVVTTWVRYTDDDLKVTPAFATGKGSIQESTEYGVSATKTIVDALEFSSDAIANDISIDKSGSADADFSAGLTSSAPSTVAGTMTFAANNCKYAADKITCDLVITGSRDNIYGGADEDHVLTFAPEYRHHKTGDACGSNTKASLADSDVTSENTLTFKFETQDDFYRGGVKVRDNDNYFDQKINLNRYGWTSIDPGVNTDHITEAEIINYDIKMDEAGVNTQPHISFDVLNDEESSCVASNRKLFFDPSQLDFVPNLISTTYPVLSETPIGIFGCSGALDQARYQFQTDCVAAGGTWSSTDYYTISVKSGAASLKPKLKPKSPYVDVQAGKSMVKFGIYVQQCGDDTRRKIVLNIQSALADSTPAVGVAVTANFNTQGSYLLNQVSDVQSSPTEITDLDSAYTKWNEVTLFFQHFQNDKTDTVQGDKVFEIDNALCPHDQFTAIDKQYLIGTTHPTGITFTKNRDCTTNGRIGFSFDGQCYYVKIDCKRHANARDYSHLSIDLDYAVSYDLTGLSVATDGDKTVDLGSATCDTDGEVTPATGDCTGLGTSIATDFAGVLNTFKTCGTPSSSGNQTTWAMKLVQGITKNSQEFCNARPLSLSITHKGRNEAKISILGLPELDIQLTLANLAYEACTAADGNAGHEVTFKIVDDTNEATVTAENSKIDGTPVSQFDLTPVTDTSYVASYVGTCQNYCGTAQTVIAFDFDAKGSQSGQDFYADVTGSLTLNGDPCTGSEQETFTAQLQSAALGTDDASCQDSSSYDSLTSQVETDGTGCFKLSPLTDAFASVFTAGQTSVRTGTGGNLVADPSINVLTAEVGDVYYYTITNLLSLAGKEVELTVEWEYEITGRRRLRATSTYLLGSSDHHSSAGLRILPAGVQIQEQIEAAPAHDVIYNGTVLNTTGDDLPDHQHTNANWGLGLGITGSVVGVGLFAVWIYTGWKRTKNGGDWLGVGKKGYRKVRQVGRFQSNMAF